MRLKSVYEFAWKKQQMRKVSNGNLSKSSSKPVGCSTSKYGNRKTDGFASLKESRRHQALLLLQASGQISELKTQVRFELIPKQPGLRACTYLADFTYLDADGKLVVEDAKGMKTDVFIVKKKLMKFVHGIDVIES